MLRLLLTGSIRQMDVSIRKDTGGEYLYLDKVDSHGPGQVCRLKFNGGEDNWSFAIYKYSSGRYDGEEIFFPGEECVDGTVEGALKAGLLAYPPY